MNKVTAVVLYCILLELLPGTVFSGAQEWICDEYFDCVKLFLVISLCFDFIKKTEIAKRTILMVFLLWSVIEAQLYFLYAFCDYNIYIKTYSIIFAVAYGLFVYNRIKQYNLPSDKIKLNGDPQKAPYGNVYICLWKPQNTITLIASLVGLPIGSISIYIWGRWWGFRWIFSKYIGQNLDPSIIQRKFIIHDTGIPATIEMKIMLNNLIGTKARSGPFRIKCVYVIRHFLEKLDSRYKVESVFDFIPAVFAKKIF